MLLALLALLPVALAHFTLDFPQSRGFDEDIEPNFCGGFTASNSSRTPFPLSSAPVLIDSHHANAQLALLISLSQNPTDFAAFNTTASNGTVVQYALPFFSVSGEGEKCFFVNVGSLGLNVSNGTNATLQVAYNGGDGALYQCADVVLVSNATVPQNVTSQCSGQQLVGPSAAVAAASASQTSSMSTTSPSASARASGAKLVVPGLALLGGAVAAVFA